MYTTWSIPDTIQFPSSSELVISMRKADFMAKSLISASTSFSSRRAASARFFDSPRAARKYSAAALANSLRNPAQNLVFVFHFRQFARHFHPELDHLVQVGPYLRFSRSSSASRSSTCARCSGEA